MLVCLNGKLSWRDEAKNGPGGTCVGPRATGSSLSTHQKPGASDRERRAVLRPHRLGLAGVGEFTAHARGDQQWRSN